jgi:hypothetical protein
VLESVVPDELRTDGRFEGLLQPVAPPGVSAGAGRRRSEHEDLPP